MKKSHDDGLTTFLLLEVIVLMGNAKKIKLSASEDKTFQDGFEEYVLDFMASGEKQFR